MNQTSNPNIPTIKRWSRPKPSHLPHLSSLFGPLLFHRLARTKLHEQARRRIERLITDRALKPGSQLPTETNLASELYVSRTTIRNALKVLEQEGKIERTPGRETIVRKPYVG